MIKNSKIISGLIKETRFIRKNKSVNFSPLTYIPDSLEFKRNAFEEFQQYLRGYQLQGEKYIPTSNNPKSVFIEYFNYRKEHCKSKPAQKIGGFSIGKIPESPKILDKNDTINSYVPSLLRFQEFIETKSQNATLADYKSVVNQLEKLMPKYVKNKHPNFREEIIDNSGKIYKWRTAMSQERKNNYGQIIYTKFFDENEKNKSIDEYKNFVENLTGKKVLIGSPRRISIAIDELGLLNDVNSYKDVDYILFGHGKGSSLIKDTKNPNTWRFSDNNKSIWEFIEEHVPKGKKVLVGCCEQDKFFNPNDITRAIPRERKLLKEMYDKSGNYMYGIGNSVSSAFNEGNPAKICESGIRHIIGHTYIMPEGQTYIESFISGTSGKAITKYYDL